MAEIQWFTYEQLTDTQILETVLNTPGAKVIRDFCVREYYLKQRYVASIGKVGDWAVYAGPEGADAKAIYALGNKTSRELGEMIFPELARLNWRF